MAKKINYSRTAHPHFCKNLDRAIKDEEEGAEFYRMMRDKVRCKKYRKIFQGMVNDERAHKSELNKMKKRFCKIIKR